MENFQVEIANESRTLTAREKVKLTDTRKATKIDDLTADGEYRFIPDYFAILAIHNEQSKDKDYTQICIITTDGVKLVTGSQSFITEFMRIYECMADETEPYEISVYRVPSKNYAGKSFITCSLV